MELGAPGQELEKLRGLQGKESSYTPNWRLAPKSRGSRSDTACVSEHSSCPNF